MQSLSKDDVLASSRMDFGYLLLVLVRWATLEIAPVINRP